MKSDKLPSVLLTKNPADSLSMERALKQIKNLLAHKFPYPAEAETEDEINASLDAIDTMLAAIDRG